MEGKERNPDIQEEEQKEEQKPAEQMNETEEQEESAIADLLHVLGIKKKLINQKTEAEKGTDTEREETENKFPLEVTADTTFPDVGNEETMQVDTENVDFDGIEQALTESLDMIVAEESPSEKRKINWKKAGIVAAGLVIIGGLGWGVLPDLTEPRPPQPDVVGSYSGNNITIDQLNKFIAVESAKEREHMLCPTHGYDHSKCDPSEDCEAHPIDSLEGYRQIVTKLAVEQIVNNWAEKQGITNREEVKHGMEDLLNDATVEQYMADLHEENISPESIPKLEVQEYYNANQKEFEGKTLEEVEDQIRQTLSEQKDEDFMSDYIEELKKTAGLQVDFEVLKTASPTEQEVLDYYNANADQYQTEEQVEYSEIKIAKEKADTADKALRRIRGGEDFQDIAKEFSPTGKSITGTIKKETDQDTGEKAILWEMKEGEVSDLVTNYDGTVSILRLDKKQALGTKPLSEVSEQIKGTLTLQKIDEEYTSRKNDILFTVHSRRYTLGEFYTEFKELSDVYQNQLLTYDSRKKLVEQIIAKELLLEKSGDGASGNDREEHGFEELKIQYLYQIMHQEEVDANLKEPTEEEIAQYYEENKEELTTPASVELSMIWIDQGSDGEKKEQAFSKANEALTFIQDGGDFAEAAKKYSEDASASSGGEISGTFYKDHLAQSIANAVFSLKKGENSEIVDYNDGYYIFNVRKKTKENLAPLEELSEGIKSHLKEQEHDKQMEDMEQKMLDEAEFTIYDRTLKKLLKEDKSGK